jgi:hypothetical protein
LAVAQHLPQGRHQAGDRHLKFHDVRDNLRLGLRPEDPGVLPASDAWFVVVLQGMRANCPRWDRKEAVRLVHQCPDIC